MNPLDWTLSQASDALRSRAISAQELTAAALDKALRLNLLVNAFVSIEHQAAMKAAALCDSTLSGAQSRLHGIPLAHKDMFDRVDRAAGFGAELGQSMPADSDATVLARLKEAGAVNIGALNMAEFALGPTGHNRVNGHCKNPWQTSHITGGSSSGSAAAVGARIVFGALGSDTGGSVRGPAACCGVTGLKPTQGAVSRAGAMPLSFSLDCIGPITRTAEDCSILYEAIAGQDPRDPSCTGPAYRHIDLDLSAARKLKVALPRALWEKWCDPEILVAVERWTRDLERSGIRCVEVPELDRDACNDFGDLILKAEAAAVHESRLLNHERFTPHVLRRIEPGLLVSAPAYIKALSLRKRLTLRLLETVGDADLFLLPSLVIPVPRIEDTDEEKIGAMPELVPTITAMMRWINYAALPALSVPIGFDKKGLPIGGQLVGRPYGETSCLQAGMLFQQATDWHDRRPVLPSS